MPNPDWPKAGACGGANPDWPKAGEGVANALCCGSVGAEKAEGVDGEANAEGVPDLL